MHRAQEQVRDFHRAMGQPAPGKLETLTVKQATLRRDLILEEAREYAEATAEAIKDGSHVVVDMSPAMADALADLLYVTYGAAVEVGLDIAPIFEAVHEANMKKGPGPVREDGKKLKPPGWTPPDHAGELMRQWRGNAT